MDDSLAVFQKDSGPARMEGAGQQQINNLKQAKESENETQTRESNLGGNFIAKLSNIVSQIAQHDGLDDFIRALDAVQLEESSDIEPEDDPAKAVESLQASIRATEPLIGTWVSKESSEQVAGTPFFGNTEEFIPAAVDDLADVKQKQNSHSQQENKQSYENQVVMSQNKPNFLQKLFAKVIDKSVSAVDQLVIAFSQANQEDADGKRIQMKANLKSVAQDNEFIDNQMGSRQSFQEIKQFVEQLKSSTVRKYMKSTQQAQQKLGEAVGKMLKGVLTRAFQQIRGSQNKLLVQSSQLSSNKKNQKPGSGIANYRMSSAQSQRLKSALSKKSSEHDDSSFQMDLTVKTRNSRNPYNISKADSLMYSAQSGFGFNPSSPVKRIHENQTSNSNKTVLAKLEQFLEEGGGRDMDESKAKKNNNFHKSYSQNQNHDGQHKKYTRLLSSKQKIEEFQEHQHEDLEFRPSKKLYRDDNEFQDPQLSQQQQYDQNTPDSPSHAAQQSVSDEKKGILQLVTPLPNKGNRASQKQSQQNFKSFQEAQIIRNKSEQYKELPRYSSKASCEDQGTIVDKVQNFDADDEEPQEKQLTESAHFGNKKALLTRKRVETEMESRNVPNQNSKNKRFNNVNISKLEEVKAKSSSNSRVNSQQNLNGQIFATEINTYQSRIQKIREEKELKKRKLEQQLARINQELNVIQQKQEQAKSPPVKGNNYASRIQISDNTEAQKKAQSLVKNLRSQKRNRNMAKIGEFQNIDKNITDYMEELLQLRAQNQEKIKQRKKIQILERMKQQEMRKMQERKKLEQNQKFVINLKGSGPLGEAEPQQQLSKRTPVKNQALQQIKLAEELPKDLKNLTPELDQKKAYLNKLRGFSARNKKKQGKDVYEQLLG